MADTKIEDLKGVALMTPEEVKNNIIKKGKGYLASIVVGGNSAPEEIDEANIKDMIYFFLFFGGDGGSQNMLRIHAHKNTLIKTLIDTVVKSLKLDKDSDYIQMLQNNRKPTLLRHRVRMPINDKKKVHKAIKNNEIVSLEMY